MFRLNRPHPFLRFFTEENEQKHGCSRSRTARPTGDGQSVHGVGYERSEVSRHPRFRQWDIDTCRAEGDATGDEEHGAEDDDSSRGGVSIDWRSPEIIDTDDIFSDYNALARLTNSSLAVTVESQLIPLRKSDNQEVEEFAVTQADIDRLNCECPRLSCVIMEIG